MCRDAAPILPANFLGKYVGKSKEQNAGKIGGKLEKWAPRNGRLAHFNGDKRSRYSNRAVTMYKIF